MQTGMRPEPTGLDHNGDDVATEPSSCGPVDAEQAVTALYGAHAGGLVRLAVVILRDRDGAEDVVQEAFCGLFRRWAKLDDPGRALIYLRSSVLNGCRSALRYRARRTGVHLDEPAAPSAEADALIGEEHRALLAGLRRLAPRQREALTLRYFADLNEAEIAESMGISRGSVKSTISRGIVALGKR
jgi:RNA polymerase sigma-70 factor (sigma-E family)